LYKNIYKDGEYNLKGAFKLTGAFLARKEKLMSQNLQKEKDIKEQIIDLETQIKSLKDQIKEKKEELNNLTEQANSVLENAKTKAELLLSDAEKQANELKEQQKKIGYEEGFDKGYYEGLEKGKAEVSNKYKELIETLKNILESAKLEKQKLISGAEEDIVNLSVEIARKIIHQEISTNKEKILEIVREAIKKIEDKEKIIIYANPEDLELIRSHRENFKQIIDTDELHIMPDELLKSGECKVESKSEIIDTDIDFQLGEIKKKLLRKK